MLLISSASQGPVSFAQGVEIDSSDVSGQLASHGMTFSESNDLEDGHWDDVSPHLLGKDSI